MRKLLFISFLAISSLTFGQIDTLEEVGSGINNFGGDSKKVAYEKINANDLFLQSRGDSSVAVFNYRDSTITILKYIDFELEDGWAMQEGRVGWNADDKTLEAGLDQGSVLQIGQEIHLRATNKTGFDIDDGAVVYVSGAQGNRPTIVLVSDTSITAILTLGVVTQDIVDNATGYVTLVGLVRGYDTRDWPAGSVLWADTERGELTNVRPPAPRTAVTLGVSLNQTEDGIIAVRPVVVQRLSWLSDVNGRDNESENDILVWNADSLFWELRDSLAINAIKYTDTYWDDLRVPLTNTRINPANSEPDFEDRGDGLFAWGFDSDSDSAYVLNFSAQGSHTRADSTDEEGHFHWQPDGTNTGNVLWRLIYSMANIGSDWTPIDTLWALDAADGVALRHQIIDFGTLVGSDTMRISHEIVGHVCRVGEDARDTYTGTAFGIELDFHYQIDGPGSEEEYIKY